MRKSIYLLSVIIFVSIFSACKDEKENNCIGCDPRFSKSFIDSILDHADGIYPKKGIDGFDFEIKGTYRGEKNYAFEEFIKKINDTSYNSYLPPEPSAVVAENFQKIMVVCGEEFNGIPAGESLGDYFYFIAQSPRWFIDNGYSEEYPQDDYTLDEEELEILKKGWLYGTIGYRPFVKKLSAVTPEDLYLIDPRFVLFPVENISLDAHTFIVTLENSDKSLSASF